MNTGAHLQYGWLIAHAREFTRPERAAITLAAAAPDLDGLTIVAGAESDFFFHYHHILFHNLLSAVVYTAVVAVFVSRRSLVVFLSLCSFFSHLLVDYLTAPWEMAPLQPFSPMMVNLGSHLPKWMVQYVFQFVGIGGILACTVWLYLKYGRTPLEIFSPRLDRLVSGYLALPWKNRCAQCQGRAHFRCDRCAGTVCGRHWKPHGLGGICSACAANPSGAGAAATGSSTGP